jgi:hypothetical protein
MDLIVGLMDFPESTELKKRLEKLLPPALQPQQKANDPVAMQQQLDQAHQMIQQLTATLQKETDLANAEQTRLQIAQLEAQTELAKQDRQLNHDAAKTTLEAEIAAIKANSDHSNKLIAAVHQHLLDKDQAAHEAALQQTAIAQPQSASTLLSPGAANEPVSF